MQKLESTLLQNYRPSHFSIQLKWLHLPQFFFKLKIPEKLTICVKVFSSMDVSNALYSVSVVLENIWYVILFTLCVQRKFSLEQPRISTYQLLVVFMVRVEFSPFFQRPPNCSVPVRAHKCSDLLSFKSCT